MVKKIELKENEFFNLEDFINENIKVYVLNGARGCGKTFSTALFIKKLFNKNKIGLYIRNARNELATARQYFNFLITDPNSQRINLGSLGASTVVLEELDETNKWTSKTLIAYTLWLADYELLKSSKRNIDYIVYEEYSSLIERGTNRMFGLTEILESVRQYNPNYYLFAISNNLYKDTLFNYLLNDNDFLEIEIKKDSPNKKINNNIINSYLSGDYLIPELTINLKYYDCLGFIEINNFKIYIFKNLLKFPNIVLSSKGTGKKIPLTTEIIGMLQMGYYKNLDERNKIEFIVGLLLYAKKKLYV